METKCLIQRFKDENKIMQNEYVAGMIVYGSRVNNCNSESSDLDVFLVSLGNNSYRASKKLNDIRIDMNIISLNHIFDLIDQAYEENASYYPSVFNTGLVEKNDDGIVDYIKDRVNNCEVEKIHKRSIHIYERIELGNLYMSLLNNSRDTNFDDYLYFNLLDKLRTNYFYINNYSRLSFPKVYDAFKKNRYITVNYQLKMPNRLFIDLYLKALEEKDYIMRLEYLSQLFAMVGIDVDELWDEHIIREKKETNIELKLVYLKDKIEKVESMLISNHPAKDYVYFVLLYKMKRLFWLITDAEIKEVEEEFKRALSVYNVDDRIKYVEAILAHIDKNYNIDYDNYLIKKY